MQIEGRWNQVSILPVERGITLGELRNPSSQSLEAWIVNTIYGGKLAPHSCTLQKVKITIEYEEAQPVP